MKNLLIIFLLAFPILAIANISNTSVSNVVLSTQSDTIKSAKVVNIFSETAIQLNFKIRDNKDFTSYKIVGLTYENEIVDLDRGSLDQLRLIRTIVDPGFGIKKVGILVRNQNKNHYFVFDAKKEINQLLELESSDSYVDGY